MLLVGKDAFAVDGFGGVCVVHESRVKRRGQDAEFEIVGWVAGSSFACSSDGLGRNVRKTGFEGDGEWFWSLMDELAEVGLEDIVEETACALGQRVKAHLGYEDIHFGRRGKTTDARGADFRAVPDVQFSGEEELESLSNDSWEG